MVCWVPHGLVLTLGLVALVTTATQDAPQADVQTIRCAVSP